MACVREYDAGATQGGPSCGGATQPTGTKHLSSWRWRSQCQHQFWQLAAADGLAYFSQYYQRGAAGNPRLVLVLVLIYLNSVSQQYIVQLGKIRMTKIHKHKSFTMVIA